MLSTSVPKAALGTGNRHGQDISLITNWEQKEAKRIHTVVSIVNESCKAGIRHWVIFCSLAFDFACTYVHMCAEVTGQHQVSSSVTFNLPILVFLIMGGICRCHRGLRHCISLELRLSEVRDTWDLNSGPLQEQYMIITSEHLCNLSAVCLLRQTLS